VARLQPTVTRTNKAYWQGCQQGELRLQSCQSCGAVQFYPRIVCSQCQHDQLDWQVASGLGRVASFTIMHHAVSADYPTPLVAALIDLAEGPRLMSHVVGDEALTVQVGDIVRVRFEDWGDEMMLPVFERVTPVEAQS